MSDLISRQAAIRWVKTECNPYGKPTLDFESGKKVIEHLAQMPSAQPEIIRCKDCIYFDRYVDGMEKYQWDGFCADWARNTYEDWFCSRAERKGEQP